MDLEKRLIDNGYEDVVIFKDYDYESAFIGVSDDNRAIYSYDKMVEYLINEQGFSEDDALDWIDYKLDELPHDKCKEYGLYSSQEKQAYKERFPNCDKVYIKKYRDGSCCTECSKGAFGNLDGICKSNISDECYMCTNYKPKTSEMKIVNECDEYYKNEKYRLENMIEYANKRLKELENDVKKYMDDHDCCNDEYDICVIEKRSSSDTGKRYSVEDLEKLILEQ